MIVSEFRSSGPCGLVSEPEPVEGPQGRAFRAWRFHYPAALDGRSSIWAKTVAAKPIVDATVGRVGDQRSPLQFEIPRCLRRGSFFAISKLRWGIRTFLMYKKASYLYYFTIILRECPRRKITAATRILTYWTLSNSTLLD